MRILDLFAGIGGFSLAAHWMGWETAAFVEWDKFPQQVLAKNFPNVPIYGDIKEFVYEREQERIGTVDLICGGFPCQPFSSAGKRNGTNDDRYLWPEMLRVIREVKPTWVVGENVAGLLSMDGGAVFEEICTSLEDEGYTVQSFVLPAISVGAPHRRDRIWIIARHIGNTESERIGEVEKVCKRKKANSNRSDELVTANPTSEQEHPTAEGGLQSESCKCDRRPSRNAECARLEGSTRIRGSEKFAEGYRDNWTKHWHEVAAELCRVDDGVPSELDKLRNSNRAKRLKALGNAIVPQVAYEIFRAINEYHVKIS